MRATLKHPVVTPLAAVSAAAIAATLVAVTSGQSASAQGPSQATSMAFESAATVSCGQTLGTFPTHAYRQVRIVGNWLNFVSDGSSAASLTFFVTGRNAGELQIGELTLAARSAKTTIIDVPGETLTIKGSCNGATASFRVLAFGN